MAQQHINVAVDSAAAESALRKLNRLFKDQGLRIQEVARVGETLNDANQLLSASFSGVLKTGQKFSAVLERLITKKGKLRNAYKIATDSIETYQVAQERATEADARALKKKEALDRITSKQALNDINKRSATKFVTQDVPTLFGPIDKNSKDTEIATIQRQIRATEKMIEAGTFTRGAFHKVFQAISLDSTATFAGMEADAAKAARAMIAAFAKVQDRINKNTASGSKQNSRNSESLKFANTDVPKLFGRLPSTATPSQSKSAQDAIRGVQRLIEAGKISRVELQRIFDEIQRNSNATFSGIQGQAAQALRRVSVAYKRAGETGLEAAKQVILSWTGVFRLFATHTLHLAISRVIFGFGEVTQKAAQLSTKIAEIQTITQDASATTDEWQKGIRRLSDSLGIDSVEIASAAYEALSNQAARGTDVFAFLSKAAIFAKVTNSDLANSVDLLTSVTNSYAKEQISAERAAEIFFTTIDLGRVKANELASSMGTVLQPASQLGIRVEEVGGAISTLSRQGINADTTLTLLRNVMVGLIKPSKEMQNLINSWGTPTAEAAIKTFGFVGILQKLSAELETGGISRLGELEGDIRKLTGTLGLTKNLDQLISDISLHDSSKGNFKEAEKAIAASLGDRFKKQITEFQNIFNIDVGGKFLKGFVEIAEKLGGVANVIKTVTAPLSDMLSVLGKVSSLTVDVGGGFLKLANAITPAGLATKSLSTITSTFLSVLAAEKILNLAGIHINLSKVQSINRYIAVTRIAIRDTKQSIVTSQLATSAVKGLTSIFTRLSQLSIKGTFNTIRAGLKDIPSLCRSAISGISSLITGLGRLRVSGRGLLLVFTAATFVINEYIESLKEARERAHEADDAERTSARQANLKKLEEQIQNYRKVYTEAQHAIESSALQASANANVAITNLTRKFLEGQKLIRGGLGIDLDSLEAKLTGDKKTNTIEESGKKLIDALRDGQKEVEDLKDSLDLSVFEGQLAFITDHFSDMNETARALNKNLKFDNLFNPLGGLVEKTDFVLNKIQQLRLEAVKLYDEGNLSDARASIDKAADLAHLLEGSNPAKAIADLAENAKKQLFDIQVDSLKGKGKKQLISHAKDLEKQAISLFNLGNIEEAKRLFSQVDSILNDVQKKDGRLSNKLKDLGVTVKSSDSKKVQKDILKNRLDILQQGAEKIANAESLSQKIAKQKIEHEQALQKALNKTVDIYTRMAEIQREINRLSERNKQIGEESAEKAAKSKADFETSEAELQRRIALAKKAEEAGQFNQDITKWFSASRWIGNLGLANGEPGKLFEEFNKANKEFEASGFTDVEAFNRRSKALDELIPKLEAYFKMRERIKNGERTTPGGRQTFDPRTGAPQASSSRPFRPDSEINLEGVGSATAGVESLKALLDELKQFKEETSTIFKDLGNFQAIDKQFKADPKSIFENKDKFLKFQEELDQLTKQAKDASTKGINALSLEFDNAAKASSSFTSDSIKNLETLQTVIEGTISKVQALRDMFSWGKTSQTPTLNKTSFNSTPDSSANFLTTTRALGVGTSIGTQNNNGGNVEIGDINLNVENSVNEAEFYRRVVSSLRREIRSGTLKLNKGTA